MDNLLIDDPGSPAGDRLFVLAQVNTVADRLVADGEFTPSIGLYRALEFKTLAEILATSGDARAVLLSIAARALLQVETIDRLEHGGGKPAVSALMAAQGGTA